MKRLGNLPEVKLLVNEGFALHSSGSACREEGGCYHSVSLTQKRAELCGVRDWPRALDSK